MQLLGLASALNKLHNYGQDGPNAESYRHGNLKPEKILRFTTEDGTGVGMLKISDLGLAKHHLKTTQFRNQATDTQYGTALYEPPEAYTDQNAKPPRPQSRQYDIWSMGCIILELIIWLLYGNDELEKFNNNMRKALAGNSSPYWMVDERRPGARAKVHPHVTGCLDFINKRDPECRGDSTAIRDLLELVQTRLLVVQLPQHTEEPSSQQTTSRAKAEDLHHALEKIVGKGNSDKRYWCRGGDRTSLRGPVESIAGQPSEISTRRANLNVPVLEPRKTVSSFFFFRGVGCPVFVVRPHPPPLLLSPLIHGPRSRPFHVIPLWKGPPTPITQAYF